MNHLKKSQSLISSFKLNKKGKYTTPMFLVENDARYYPQYELFASAYHLTGFVELFHNSKKK